ncbi:hypothetical protein R1flu_003918 [Riccia fluitans]|uniref:Uncharacterized protein n=1 Tax=Riccia fluitans TaxID=41844 RepID=A0ABD1YAC3_9MARC
MRQRNFLLWPGRGQLGSLVQRSTGAVGLFPSRTRSSYAYGPYTNDFRGLAPYPLTTVGPLSSHCAFRVRDLAHRAGDKPTYTRVRGIASRSISMGRLSLWPIHPAKGIWKTTTAAPSYVTFDLLTVRAEDRLAKAGTRVEGDRYRREHLPSGQQSGSQCLEFLVSTASKRHFRSFGIQSRFTLPRQTKLEPQACSFGNRGKKCVESANAEGGQNGASELGAGDYPICETLPQKIRPFDALEGNERN